jgi:hypothetical protein
MRKIEIGKTRSVSSVILNSSAISGIALLHIDEPMVLFMTCITPEARTRNFLLWEISAF